MDNFRLATVAHNSHEGSAIVLGERIHPLTSAAPDRPDLHRGLFDLLQRWDTVYPELRRVAAGLDAAGGVAPDDPSIMVLAPIRYPRGVYCTVFNYYDFALAIGVEPPDKTKVRPYICPKLPNCVIGPNDPVILPSHSQKVDWEVELGAVIGRPCRGATAEHALDYVAGYTIVNDLSAVDGPRPDWPNFGWDWLQAKGFDTSSPLGPYILPAEFVADPNNVRLRLTRNGVLMQNGTTASMIFNVQEQIAYLSGLLTLLPGDVIATGTPAGVGRATNTFLRPGDEIICEVEGIGILRNPVT